MDFRVSTFYHHRFGLIIHKIVNLSNMFSYWVYFKSNPFHQLRPPFETCSFNFLKLWPNIDTFIRSTELFVIYTIQNTSHWNHFFLRPQIYFQIDFQNRRKSTFNWFLTLPFRFCNQCEMWFFQFTAIWIIFNVLVLIHHLNADMLSVNMISAACHFNVLCILQLISIQHKCNFQFLSFAVEHSTVTGMKARITASTPYNCNVWNGMRNILGIPFINPVDYFEQVLL